MNEKRVLFETVELDRDCDLGKKGERAVVVKLEPWKNMVLMTLVFPNRSETREVSTGADYRFLKGV